MKTLRASQRAAAGGPLRRHPYVLGLLLVIVVWIVSSHFGFVGRTILASPLEVAKVLLQAVQADGPEGSRVFLHASGTIGRALSGWLVAVGLGITMGMLVGANMIVYRGSEPLVELARAIPPIMVFPLLLVAFNYESSAYVWTIVYGCLPIMILTVARGARRVSPEKLEVLDVFGASRRVRMLASIMEILPSCFLGARLTLSISLVIAVVTEMVFTPRSGIALGSLAKDAEISFDTPVFYAAVLVIGLFGYVTNAAMRALEDRIGTWPPRLVAE